MVLVNAFRNMFKKPGCRSKRYLRDCANALECNCVGCPFNLSGLHVRVGDLSRVRVIVAGNRLVDIDKQYYFHVGCIVHFMQLHASLYQMFTLVAMRKTCCFPDVTLCVGTYHMLQC